MTQTKLKKKRLGYYAGEKLASLTENQIMNLKREASLEAVELFFIIAVLSAKETFYDLTDNESMEKMLQKMAKVINMLDNKEVTLDTLINVVDGETGLLYDRTNRVWKNTQKNNQIVF